MRENIVTFMSNEEAAHRYRLAQAEALSRLYRENRLDELDCDANGKIKPSREDFLAANKARDAELAAGGKGRKPTK